MSTPDKPYIEFIGVSKNFAQVQALKKISLKIQKGHIHALIGENGAGKSTAVKILYGIYSASSGEIYIQNQKIEFTSPVKAKAHRIGMVHQHFMLAGPVSALDHMILESSEPSLSRLNRLEWLDKLNSLSQKYHLPVPWEKPIEELSVGQQQRIEILKLLHNDAEILILDEPTAVLTPQEIESFFDQLRALKKQGKTILIITHKLKEVMALADEVTVFRKGEVVFSSKISDTHIEELGEHLVGEKLTPPSERNNHPENKVRLAIKDLDYFEGSKQVLNKLSLEVKTHEVLGLAGIEGNGQSELLKSLMIPQEVRNHIPYGQVFLDTTPLLDTNTQNIRRLGVSYFPEDRLSHGAVAEMSAEENYLLGQQHSQHFNRSGWIQHSSLQQKTREAFEQFQVRPPQPELKFASFSGGNQQKIVVAREILEKPKLLIAAQPTRGVDIGAIDRIHKEILKLRENGCAILLVSSELDELIKLSDRILVVFQGQIVGEFLRGSFDEKAIGALMGGHR